ncbi:MAG: response regulator [Anaerolineales bacterium]|nr:response regulator [Anaerolineales bacterium]
MAEEAFILLVEDNEMDVVLTLDAFQEARLRNPVHVASTGERALDYLHGRGKYQDRDEYPLPDIILLDLKLPGISGMDVLREIKDRPTLKQIPVIILSSSSEEADRALGYDLGVNSYLVKPVSFEGFLSVVGKIKEYWLTINLGPPRKD